ncbi:MAG: TIGR02270 family protein [Nannocystis sp.]|nr:TIGR02270 family protein [Nannocystis sp.]MBA3548089.1 TIGR02270 family protein [Nannocystis sp.]
MSESFEPLWELVDDHLDEAEFLWERWEASMVAPNYSMREVEIGPEGRLMAHLNALLANGMQVADRLLLPTIADIDAEPTRVRAAALALLQTPGPAGFDAVFTELYSSPAQRPELARALECCELGPLYPRLGSMLAAEDADLRYTAARVLAFHDEALDQVVPRMLTSDRSVDRMLGLRLIPRLVGTPRHTREVMTALGSDHPDVRDVALTAGVLLDLPQAWRCAQGLANACDPGAGQALLLLALRGDPADRAAILTAVASLRGPGLWALGFLGTVDAVDAAIPWLEDEAHARLAGEVIAAITGLDLEDENFVCFPPEEEALSNHPEDDLPLPDALKLLMWWRKQRSRFAVEQRYLAGRPHDAVALRQMLCEGPMRRRPAYLLALQLGLPANRRPQLEPMAPIRRQRRQLAGLFA